MWQEIVIIIIAILVVCSVGYKLYCYFTKPASPCDDCNGCALKDELKKKNFDCDIKRNNPQ